MISIAAIFFVQNCLLFLCCWRKWLHWHHDKHQHSSDNSSDRRDAAEARHSGRRIFVGLCCTCSAVLGIFAMQLDTTTVTAVQVLLLAGVFFFAPVPPGPSRRQYAWAVAALLSLGLGIAFRQLGISRGPLCEHPRSPVFQSHAAWHLCTAAAIACCFCSLRSEEPSVAVGSSRSRTMRRSSEGHDNGPAAGETSYSGGAGLTEGGSQAFALVELSKSKVGATSI